MPHIPKRNLIRATHSTTLKRPHFSHRVIKGTQISSLSNQTLSIFTRHTELSKDPDMYESLNSKFDLANYKFPKYTMYIDLT